MEANKPSEKRKSLKTLSLCFNIASAVLFLLIVAGTVLFYIISPGNVYFKYFNIFKGYRFYILFLPLLLLAVGGFIFKKAKKACGLGISLLLISLSVLFLEYFGYTYSFVQHKNDEHFFVEEMNSGLFLLCRIFCVALILLQTCVSVIKMFTAYGKERRKEALLDILPFCFFVIVQLCCISCYSVYSMIALLVAGALIMIDYYFGYKKLGMLICKNIFLVVFGVIVLISVYSSGSGNYHYGWCEICKKVFSKFYYYESARVNFFNGRIVFVYLYFSAIAINTFFALKCKFGFFEREEEKEELSADEAFILLEELKKLWDDGIITEFEYEQKKNKFICKM